MMRISHDKALQQIARLHEQLRHERKMKLHYKEKLEALKQQLKTLKTNWKDYKHGSD
jgi:uncharacterized coiled-coil DUF342 family protein